MPPLATDLRNKLERTIIAARDVAQNGAEAALQALAVHEPKFYPHMTKPQQVLRNQLRAHGRQVGDQLDRKTGEQTIGHLVHECAYEHWHRMLFARFLAENDLLIEPESGVAITLSEAEELAKAAKVDLWTYASRCAQQMLPQIFRPDDPLLQVALANEYRVKLERLLAGLDASTFTADDSLGWVYQFWQTAEKKRVNESGEKITGDTLPAVTQLFTEHYMVLFLLHNTIGAWHAGKMLAANPKLAETAASEEVLRQAVALNTAGGYAFEYLRFVRGADGKGGPWRPAAGMFAGWPRTAALLKVLDPCCGSGHFLVAACELLVRLRMAEEGTDLPHAVDAVLADNLFGLELDARCTQIAAFNLALAAWKLAGHRPLPPMHIACTGIGPQATQEQWLKLVDDAHQRRRIPTLAREPIKNGLINLHELFSKAPTLGSLIDPTQLPGDLIAADYETLLPVLNDALAAEGEDAETCERIVAARGMVKAVELLAEQYTLVATNVPYLGRPKQSEILMDYCARVHPAAKADLATCFVERCNNLCAADCTTALVTPQNWLFLGSYQKFREELLRHSTWNVVARLGPRAFETIGGEVVNVSLLAITQSRPTDDACILGIDAVGDESPAAKNSGVRDRAVIYASQAGQLQNPDSRFAFDEQPSGVKLLKEYAECYQGIRTGDRDRFVFSIWEVSDFGDTWDAYRNTSKSENSSDGITEVLRWERGCGSLHEYAAETRDKLHDMHESGNLAWGKVGVAINQMSNLRASLYFGEKFDGNVNVIFPTKKNLIPALWSFCSSSVYEMEVRRLDQKLAVTNATLVKVPFDLARWQKLAEETYSTGLAEPASDDPVQWFFHGRPDESTVPLQVAVARLLGYRWPAELDEKMHLSKRARGLVAKTKSLLKFADDDGIVCIPSVRGEEPAADRLLALLSACGIKPDRNLDDWLRGDFFQEHCDLFHQRPFVWHIWDGRKRDGFHALINYHKLADGKKGYKLLEKLAYTYLGDWISRQKDGVKSGEDGAEDRLAAATELQKRLVSILEGEPPFDLFVRWKALAEQAIGWEPDINDGVRLNIRPFLADDLPNGKKGAGVLRSKPNIKWDKDRGKEPERKKAEYPWFWGWDEKTEDFMGGKEFKGERFNNCHYTVAAKRAAREAVEKGRK